MISPGMVYKWSRRHHLCGPVTPCCSQVMQCVMGDIGAMFLIVIMFRISHLIERDVLIHMDTHNTACRRENLHKSMIFAAHTEGNSSRFIARHVSGFPSANLFVDRLVRGFKSQLEKVLTLLP